MKKKVEHLFVYKSYSIKEVLKIIDSGAIGMVIVVDEDKKIIGTITDGDIRRAILQDYSIDEPIEKIVHHNPICGTEDMDKEQLKDLLVKKAVKVLPIIDKFNVVIDYIKIEDILLPEGKENLVVIMAGGLGTRLKDLTKEIPKPMLKVGQDPILHHIINNFKEYGYNKMLISVNYKAEIIENYFQNGFAFGVDLEYIKEKKRLGTAGGLFLVKDYMDKSFFVINGDIFTNLNADNMMQFHNNGNYDITVGTRKHTFHIPYGVIDIDNNLIQGIKEKPELEYLINAGVYCLKPEVLKFIPEDTYYEITDLISACIDKGLKVGSYEIKEYWMDIGMIEDYNKVNDDFNNNKSFQMES